ncbi:MAG: alpha/beta hydrolase, partial [Gammaproteobacteria bacterium]
MYVITNREVIDSEPGLAKFGARPNARGPNELRLAEVRRRGRGWNVAFLDDELTAPEASALIAKFCLALDPAETHYASLKVACELAETARRKKSHILFFVHGYNNDLADVFARAEDIARRYNVLVVPFSWPANGGGALTGTLSYKSDKRDARASTGALERALKI